MGRKRVCVHMCYTQREVGRKGDFKHKQSDTRNGRVTVKAKLSHLSGFSCLSSSVRKM